MGAPRTAPLDFSCEIIYNWAMKDENFHVDTGTLMRFWLVPLGFSAVIGAIFLARGALILIAIAFFLTLVLNRPVSFIARHLPGRSRAFATLIAYLLIVAIATLLFFNVVPIFAKQISSFLGTLPDTLNSLKQNSHFVGDFLAQYNLTDQYNSWLHNVEGDLTSVASAIGGSFVGMLSGLLNFLVNLIFVLVLTFLMLVEGPMWEEKFWRLVYSNTARRRRHQAIARKMYNVVSGYISGQATVAVISASLTAICIVILAQIFPSVEISLALTAWLAIFIMFFVPMFGATLGGGIVALLLLLSSWPAAVIYLIFFLIEQQIENNLIQPHVQSKKINMSALLVLIAVIVGLYVGGILGALVAIPAAGCAMVLGREWLATRRVRAARAVGEDLDPDNEPAADVVFQETRDYVQLKLPKIQRRKTKK